MGTLGRLADTPAGAHGPSGTALTSNLADACRAALGPGADQRDSFLRRTGVGLELATRLGATTVQRAYSILAQTLDDAVRDRMLAASPARGVKLPKRPPARNVYLTRDQLGMLADESGGHRGLVLLLGVGGLRWGEAAALRVSDVDFLRCRISLSRNAVMVSDHIEMGPLKGHENRTVVVPRFVIDALSAAAAGKGRDELLWSTSKGTPCGPPCGNTGWLVYAVRRCQAVDPDFPRVTAHALRHTAASLAISAGANVKVVQRMLGHAKAAMTLDVYADLFDADLESVAETVGTMWARRETAITFERYGPDQQLWSGPF